MNLDPNRSITLPQFFAQAKEKNEYIGLLTLSKEDFFNNHVLDSTYVYIQKYFSNMLHPTCGITQDDINTHGEKIITDRLGFDIPMYAKSVWLLDEYLNNNNKFTNIMGGHWNPDIGTFKIHPGTTRINIFYLFGPEYEEFIIFNTGGKQVSWNCIFESHEQLLSYFSNRHDKISLTICNDLGTIIPHIHTEIVNNIKWYQKFFKYSKKLYNFFTTTKIETNFDLIEFKYNEDDVLINHQNTAIVELAEVNRTSIIRALLLLPIVEHYDYYGITINKYSNDK